jgi:hypothetical protein
VPTSWEHEIDNAATVASIFDTVVDAGAALSLDSTLAHDSAKSLKLVAVSAQAYGSKTVSSNVVVMRFWMYVAALPSADAGICSVVDSAQAHAYILQVQATTGLLQHRIQSTNSTTGISIVAGKWYLIDLKIVRSATTTCTVDVFVNGVAGTQGTDTMQTLTTWGTVAWGTIATGTTITTNYDGLAYSLSASDFPLGYPKYLDNNRRLVSQAVNRGAVR